MKNKLNDNQNLGLHAAIFTAFICVLFGANAVAIKIGLTGLGTYTSAGIRFSMAVPSIWLWALFTGQSFYIPRKHVLNLLFISIIFTIQMSCYYKGLSYMSASRTTLIVNMQPFFVLFLAHCFIPEDRITKRKFMGIIMGFIGICFLFMEKKGLFSDFQQGDLIVLLATFLWAVNAVYVKKILENLEPFHVVLYPMAFAIPFLFFQGFLFDDFTLINATPKVISSLLYQGLIATAFGFVAWTTLLKKYGTSYLHSFLFVMPIAGVFLGGFILNEEITLKMIVCLALIVSGIIVVQLQPNR